MRAVSSDGRLVARQMRGRRRSNHRRPLRPHRRAQQSGSHSINPGETIWRVERVYHTGASNAKGSEQYVRTPGLFVCIEKGKDTEKIISTNEILQENKNNIFSVDEIVPNQISPARVRDCIRRGLSVKHRTHDEVVDCIKDQKLYISE